MIFDKMLKVDVNTLDDSASVTLMSTDVDRITTGLEDLHEIWASPIDVGIAAWLLERQVGWVAVVPIIVALCPLFHLFISYSRLLTLNPNSVHNSNGPAVAIYRASTEAME